MVDHIHEAIEADNPYNINVVKQVIIYLMIGFIIGAGILFMVFYFDRTIKSAEQVNKYATTKIPYTDLYKLVETKTNYYFLTGTNVGFNVIKANCSQELLDYIENDLKKIIKH